MKVPNGKLQAVVRGINDQVMGGMIYPCEVNYNTRRLVMKVLREDHTAL